MARTHASRLDALEAQVGSLDSKLDRLLALIEPDAPAKTARPKKTRKPARKVTPKPATKGSRMAGHGSGMTKQDWNRTLSAKARLAGRNAGAVASVYRCVMDDWAEVQALRLSGATPDEVLALYVG